MHILRLKDGMDLIFGIHTEHSMNIKHHITGTQTANVMKSGSGRQNTKQTKLLITCRMSGIKANRFS